MRCCSRHCSSCWPSAGETLVNDTQRWFTSTLVPPPRDKAFFWESIWCEWSEQGIQRSPRIQEPPGLSLPLPKSWRCCLPAHQGLPESGADPEDPQKGIGAGARHQPTLPLGFELHKPTKELTFPISRLLSGFCTCHLMKA